MINKEAKRIVLKRKLRRLIRNIEILLLDTPHTLAEHNQASELTIDKIKFQLKLNSLLCEEAKGADELKKLEEERKALQTSLADELENGIKILDLLIESFKKYGMNDRAEQLTILRYMRETELEELAIKEIATKAD